MQGGLALELGYGRGIGARIILDEFGADTVHAFDLDAHMVRIARQAMRDAGKHSVFWVGNAVTIPARDNSYDAVFDFGAIHHVSTGAMRSGKFCECSNRGAASMLKKFSKNISFTRY